MMIPASDMNIVNSEKFVLNYQVNEKKGPLNNVTASARHTHNRTSDVVLPKINASKTARGNLAQNQQRSASSPRNESEERPQPGSEEHARVLKL